MTHRCKNPTWCETGKRTVMHQWCVFLSPGGSSCCFPTRKSCCFSASWGSSCPCRSCIFAHQMAFLFHHRVLRLCLLPPLPPPYGGVVAVCLASHSRFPHQVGFVLATECVGGSKRTVIAAVYPAIFAGGERGATRGRGAPVPPILLRSRRALVQQ